MITKEKILAIAEKKGKVTSSTLSDQFSVTRQYVNLLIKDMIQGGELVKIGSTRNAFYVLPKYAKAHPELFPNRFQKTYKNKGLEETAILHSIQESFPRLKQLPENIQSIFTYAFSEMFNNAIEHSGSDKIVVELVISGKKLSFSIRDFGVGVFRNVMQKHKLKTELEAIQDILKGKTTTMPKSHSGEGIFFTSKAGDLFTLDSFDYELIVDNTLPDVFVKKLDKEKKGTLVIFQISISSALHLNDIFKPYANLNDDNGHGFDKTEIRIKLYTIGGVHISRSQARRVLAGLEKFKIIVFDFDKVPTVGQAFADEVFRVFHRKHPQIKLEAEHMSEGVQFMVERARNEAKKKN